MQDLELAACNAAKTRLCAGLHSPLPKTHLSIPASIADLSSLRAVFPPEASEGGRLNIFVPRLIFILIQGAGLAFGAWKLHTMGLLPTHASDFVSSLSVPVNKEFSSAGTSLV